MGGVLQEEDLAAEVAAITGPGLAARRAATSTATPSAWPYEIRRSQVGTRQQEPGGQEELRFPGGPAPARQDPAEIAAAWEEWDASAEGRADTAGRQRQVAGTLGRLLGHGCERRLPPVSWAITCTGPQLIARCDGYPNRQRPACFAEWRAELTALAGPPDYAGERAFARGGQTRASAVWENFGGVRVSLSAEWDTPDADSQPAAGMS